MTEIRASRRLAVFIPGCSYSLLFTHLSPEPAAHKRYDDRTERHEKQGFPDCYQGITNRSVQ